MRSFPSVWALGLVAAATLLPALDVRAQDAEPAAEQPDEQPDDGFPAAELYKTLTTGLERDKQAALDRLENNLLGHPKAGEVLAKAVEKLAGRAAAADSTLRMVQLLEHFDGPEVTEVLVKLLDAPFYKLVMVAVDTLGARGEPVGTDKMIELAEREEFTNVYGFRKCVIEALIKLNDKRAIQFLIDQLAHLQGQLQYDVIRYLSHVSLQRFHLNVEHWQTWWDDNSYDFEFTETDEPFALDASEPADFTWPGEVAEFYGLKIYAKRLVFVIDRSSSMNQMIGNETRFAQAQRELTGAIQGLPEDTRFNIVIFDGKVASWQRRLVTASPDVKEKAVKFVAYMKTGKGTASYDALDMGFRVDGNTEALFFLTDGQPSAGRITDPPTIVAVITKENFFRRIVIYSIGVNPGGGEAFLRDLAKRNRGTYKGVN